MQDTHEYAVPFQPGLSGHVRIPFGVQANATAICVELLDRPPRPAVIDLGIADPTRTRAGAVVSEAPFTSVLSNRHEDICPSGRAGRIVSINHPFDQFKPGIAWHWDTGELPAVETWNGRGPPWR